MKLACRLILLTILAASYTQAHSLQGTFGYEQTAKYGSKTFTGTGITEIENLTKGRVIATTKATDGTVIHIQHFTPTSSSTGRYRADNFDDYHGRIRWSGTYVQRGKRVIIDATSRNQHKAKIVWSMRGGKVHLRATHYHKGRKIGTATGTLTPL